MYPPLPLISELGGMYAGKIRLIGTEQGVGVRNAGNLGASAGEFTLTADGRLINTGQITATSNVQITSREGIDNTGVIAASNTLAINSDGTLSNTGNGALYADDIDIDVESLENLRQDGTSPIIAARNQLDIGADTITNRNGAVLYSEGDINIGGELDNMGTATGVATTINNNSGIVDAGGDIDITAVTINNTNEDFQTQQVQTSSEQVQEFALVGSPNRYRPDQVSLRPDRNDDVNFLVTPEGEGDAYNQFDYARRVTETQIVSSSPAQITAGGDIRITADTLINDNSRVLSAGVLTADLDSLINTETAGQRVTTENGTLTTFTRRNRKGSDSTRVTVTALNPAPRVESTDLNQAGFEGGADVAGSGTDVLLLSNALFSVAPDSTATFLVATDPRFTNLRAFLSSAFVLDQLLFDPALTQKRLGDGFFEQRLVRDQIAQLTGRRFLDGYVNEESQYRDLLNAGITAVNEFNLQPGIALTASQIAQLTSDVVLLVEQEVTLPNGVVTKALVPQLYARPQQGDITGNGGLLAAATINLGVTGTLQNGATIAGRQVVSLNAETIQNLGGRVTAPTTNITATNDINLQGGTFEAQDRLSLTAGNNINAQSVTSTQTNAQSRRTNINRVASLFIGNTNTNAVLVASAGNNLNLNGVQLLNLSENGTTQLTAGNAMTLGSVDTSLQQASIRDANNFRKETRQDQVGSTLTASGNITLNAGTDITTTAANLSSEQGQINFTAGNDVNINVGRSTLDFEEGLKIKSSGFLSSTTRTRRDSIKEDNAVGTVLSANTVNLQAGNDINVTGSDAVASNGLTLNAQNQINITEATNTRLELNLREKKKSGLFSSGGLGVTLGTQQLNKDTSTQVASAAGSTLGSVQGNVELTAGTDFTQTGSSVSAPEGDVTITAQNIDINAAQTTSTTTQETRFKQSGISLSITNPVVSAIQTTQRVTAAASDTKDSRLKALAAATVGLSAYNALDAVQQGQAVKDGNAVDKLGGINISISLGSSKSKSTTTQTSATAVSSVIAAGNNLTLNATGTPNEGVNEGGDGDGEALPTHPNTGGDINITGSELRAGNNATLIANNALNIQAQQNIASLERESKGSSASVGVGFSLGSKGTGFNITASASRSKGSAEGDDTTNTLSRVDAGNIARLESGEDTTLKGGIVTGKQIIAKVGGDLNIESTQDTSSFTSKQRSGGLSVSIPVYGASTFTAGANASKSDIDSEFKSVIEQSGFKAGDGGFDVTVQGNTDLKGAVIASNQTAIQNNANQLTTGTLTTSNLENNAQFEADAIGFSASVSINTKKEVTGLPTPLSAGGVGEQSDKAQSATLSGVSSGTITITDEAAQQALTGQDANTTVALLNREVDSDKDTTNALDRIFDEQTVQRDIDAQVLITQEFGKVAPKAVADFTAGIARELSLEALAIKSTDPKRAAELEAEAAKYDEGGIYRIALQTVVGGLSGGLEGALGAGVAAKASDLLGTLQKTVKQNLTSTGLDNDTADLLSQGLAQLTAIGLGNAVGGKAGALSSLAVDTNNRQLHFVEAQVLTTLQKDKTKPQQQRLSDAACALVKCAEGVPPSDENYTELLAKQQRGEAYQAEQAELLSTGLFGQSRFDVFNDFLLRNDFAFVKGEGIVRVVGGVAGVIGGGSLALASGAGCVPSVGLSCAGVPLGLAVVGFSGNEAVEGRDALVTTYESTIGQDVLNSFNVATHPGDRNRAAELGINIPIFIGEFAIAKIGGKAIVEFFEKRFGKGVSDKLAPISNEAGIARTLALRNSLDIGKGRTAAFAEVNVTGFKGEVVGFSGAANRGTKLGESVIAGNTVRVGPGKLDAEVKILDNLRQTLDPSAKGTIRLFVDQPALKGVCQSCTNDILGFRRDFPGIDLIISTP